MRLSYQEIMNLIEREKEKYEELSQDRGYSAEHHKRVAFYSKKALISLEKSVRVYLSKKYR